MYKILGITNDVTTCDCCGKTNLKKTVVLGGDEGTVFYGTQCAALTLKGSKKQAGQVEWIANEIRLANKWLAKGFTVEQVRKGLADRGTQAKTKDGILSVRVSDNNWQEIQ